MSATTITLAGAAGLGLVPTVLIEVEYESLRPRLSRFGMNSQADRDRMANWLESHEEIAELVGTALELSRGARAA